MLPYWSSRRPLTRIEVETMQRGTKRTLIVPLSYNCFSTFYSFSTFYHNSQLSVFIRHRHFAFCLPAAACLFTYMPLLFERTLHLTTWCMYTRWLCQLQIDGERGLAIWTSADRVRRSRTCGTRLLWTTVISSFSFFYFNSRFQI